MANKTITERLQPSLLDRLTDHDPTAKSESRDERVVNLRRLRDIVRRDLAWLLNSNNQENLLDPELYPYASRSVLNYGVREASGDFSTKDRANDIRKAIHRAITLYEPRIKEGTLEVTLRPTEHKSLTVIEFDIHADMWAQPLPMELFLRSQIDLNTGQISLEGVD